MGHTGNVPVTLPLSGAGREMTPHHTKLEEWQIPVLTAAVVLTRWACLHSASWEVPEKYPTLLLYPVCLYPLRATLPEK
jgi:hypothetical protein